MKRNSFDIPWLTILVSITIIVAAYNFGEDRHIWSCCLISVYLIFYVGVMKIYRYVTHVFMFFICLLTFIRYFLIPVLICADNDFMTYSPLDSDVNSKFFYNGILFTIWEALFLGFYLFNRLPKWYNRGITSHLNNRVAFKKESISLLVIEIVFMFFLVLVSPGVLGKYSFMFNLDGNDMINMSEEASMGLLDTIAILGARILKTLLPIPFVYILYKKYHNHHNSIYFLISALCLIVFYALIMEGNSRNSIIIPAISIIFILATLYPSYKKTIWITMVTIIAVISVLSIIFKVFRNDITAAMEADTLSYWISYLDIYFAGICNMGRVVSAKIAYGEDYNNFLLMINDTFSNIPLLSKITDSKYSSLYLFLKFWERNDQVIPSSGNGLFYFGYFFAPVVPVFITTLAHYFEKKSYEARYLTEFIVYTFACATISYNIFNQISSLMMKIFVTVLPIIFIVYINKRMNSKRKVYNLNVKMI